MEWRGKIHVGTSGWYYDHWKGPFYPEDLPKKKFLEFYMKNFRSLEINSSFYHLPKSGTFQKWRDTAPPGFVFSVKASRYITHRKRLKDPDESLPPLLDRVEVLGEKLGPVLFQLPPSLPFDVDRFKAFLAALPQGFKYAFEFRNESWFDGKVYDMMSQEGVAFCMYELAGRISPKEITASFVYVRLHGPEGPYQGQYETHTLSGWAGDFSTWAGQGRDVYCYFDNDEAGYAAQDALRLQGMLSG